MTEFETAPIACTLSSGDYKTRVGWIESLARQSLRSAKRAGLSLELTYGPEAAAQVREMVRKEQSCCGFLRFELRENEAGVHLTVTAPERAREAADILFAHFAPGAASASPAG